VTGESSNVGWLLSDLVDTLPGMVTRVPWSGGEKESLQASLQRHRDVIVWKLEGLDDEQLRRPMVDSGTNLLGLVKHLAAVEYGWFCQTFGRPVEAKCSEIESLLDDEPNADLQVAPAESTQHIVAFYARACAAADDSINEADLVAMGTSWDGNQVSMRWVLIHMIEETARHAGHMDIMRELIDGATGDHNRAAT
jgi:uncharacterized damage-inducible protein DinB